MESVYEFALPSHKCETRLFAVHHIRWTVIAEKKHKAKCLSFTCGVGGSRKCACLGVFRLHRPHEASDSDGDDSDSDTSDDEGSAEDEVLREAVLHEVEKVKTQSRLYGYIPDQDTGLLKPNCVSWLPIPKDLTAPAAGQIAQLLDDTCRLAASNCSPVVLCDADTRRTCFDNDCDGTLKRHETLQLDKKCKLPPFVVTETGPYAARVYSTICDQCHVVKPFEGGGYGIVNLGKGVMFTWQKCLAYRTERQENKFKPSYHGHFNSLFQKIATGPPSKFAAISGQRRKQGSVWYRA